MFTINSVRELKGAPLSCFCLLLACTQPVSQEWLERWSGYTDKPVSQALALLAEKGFITKTKVGWALSDGEQLTFGESRKISDSSSINLDQDIKDLNLSTINNNKSRKYSDSEMASIWSIFYAAGIKKNRRTEALLELEWVSVEYLLSLRSKFEREGKNLSRWGGAFIRSIEDHEGVDMSVLSIRQNGHPNACSCVECKVNDALYPRSSC